MGILNKISAATADTSRLPVIVLDVNNNSGFPTSGIELLSKGYKLFSVYSSVVAYKFVVHWVFINPEIKA